MKTFKQLGVHSGNSSWRFQEALPVWILADGSQDFSDSILNTSVIDRRRPGRFRHEKILPLLIAATRLDP
jgi:hypothetical protein